MIDSCLRFQSEMIIQISNMIFHKQSRGKWHVVLFDLSHEILAIDLIVLFFWLRAENHFVHSYGRTRCRRNCFILPKWSEIIILECRKFGNSFIKRFLILCPVRENRCSYATSYAGSAPLINSPDTSLIKSFMASRITPGPSFSHDIIMIHHYFWPRNIQISGQRSPQLISDFFFKAWLSARNWWT